MKKWKSYLRAGVMLLLTLCMAGCGGVSHKSPEGVAEDLIQSYVDGNEDQVKVCYDQSDNTEESLQSEISATIQYYQAHNAKKVSIQNCDVLFKDGDYTYVYISYHLILQDDQEYPCIGTYMIGKKNKQYYILAPSQITDDMRTQAAEAYAEFMQTDIYKTYTKEYDTFIKKNPGYEQKISESLVQ